MNTNIEHSTHRELSDRRPWNASAASSDIWLLLKSLKKKGKEKHIKKNRTEETESNLCFTTDDKQEATAL